MSATKSRIPPGARSVTPHLVVRGGKAAIEFYKAAFGATEIRRFPAESGDRLMFAEVRIGDSNVYLSDEFPEACSMSPQATNGTPVTIHLYVEDVDRVFDQAVKAGAKPVMAVSDMFWGDRYGLLADPFGHRWSIASQVAACGQV